MSKKYCSNGDKIRYNTKKKVIKALSKIKVTAIKNGQRVYPTGGYRCPNCQGWHLTSQHSEIIDFYLYKKEEKKMEEEEKQAYLYGAAMGAEYLKEIGKSDLALLTPEEALTFAECMCKSYHLKHAEIVNI